MKKEGRLITKSIETIEEIPDPFKMRSMSPTFISRRLNLLKDTRTDNLKYDQRNLYKYPNKFIRITMAIISSKGKK